MFLEEKIYCPYCRNVYDDNDIERKIKKEPMIGMYRCKKCKGLFNVSPYIEQMYTYEVKPLENKKDIMNEFIGCLSIDGEIKTSPAEILQEERRREN